jgi:membrane protease YdiL (CAAX protease family)
VIAVFTAVAVVVALVLHGLTFMLGWRPASPYSLDDPRLAFGALANLFSGAAASWVAARLGQETGLSRPRLLGWGLLAGALVVSLSVGFGGLISGAVGVSSCSNRFEAGLLQLVCVGPTALGEELWLRGAALRAAARGLTPVVAIVGTGLVFGALHLTNPDATWIAAVNVALVGIWFGAMAWRAQSIWPAVGAHLAWNWFEGFFWGQNVSGIEAGCSLLTATARAPFWGGGAFGPEASGMTAVLLAAASVVTLRWPSEAAHGEAQASMGEPR